MVRAVGHDELMSRIIERLFTGLAAAGLTDQQSPPRGGFTRGETATGVLEWMPFHEPGRGVTIKTVAYSPANPTEFQLPTILGNVARYDDVTGRLVAIMDAVLLTAMRTGAASAVASRLLANPRSRVVGMVGAGAQAITQVHALSRVFDLREVLVWDTTPAHLESFAARVAFTGLDVRAATTEELFARADIICTATSSPRGHGPVLPERGHREHLHINAVGSDLAGKTELPKGLLDRAFVCPDHLEQASREGECQQMGGRNPGPGLAELCADPAQAVAYQSQLTVFDSTGIAVEDHLALDVFLELAEEFGLGNQIQLEYHPTDTLNPYANLLAPGPAASVRAH
ncbi:ornithine cyclodeaminase family protein [Micromonospora sp. KC606]|nr:ornithine cyclodeaminase family protein [Micromonospora sp. KC606]